jgi:hypothetical protein
MTWNFDTIKTVLSYTLVLTMAIGSGYYFGYKTSQANVQTELAKQKPPTESVQTKIITKEVAGVQWIKPNQDPKCDQDHPVKGNLSNNINNYYTQNHKNYQKITPEICFATEEFARDTAGFIKKF